MLSSRNRPKRYRLTLGAVVAVGGMVAIGACGSPSNPDALGTGGSVPPGDASGICLPGHEGCPCDTAGQTTDCGRLVQTNGGYVTCSAGTSTCQNGTWGACMGSSFITKSLHGMASGMTSGGRFHPLDIPADGGPCTSPADLCDPNCGQVYEAGLPDGAPVLVTDSGIQILPSAAEGGACVGVQCLVPSCAAGKTTTVTGKVYDPASLNPVFNAVVMIPTAASAVQPIPAGVSSDPCGGATLPPAVTFAYTDTSGNFTLTGVPVGAAIPLVIQIGRWRRISTINTSTLTCGNSLNVSPNSACQGTYAGTAGCATRLPRIQSEGNIPHIAIGTGGLDAIECMLYRMGVSSTEYTDELHSGRINIFNNGGANLGGGAANHDVSYLLGFACPAGSGCPASVTTSTTNINNPSFETGNFNGWVTAGSNKQISNWWQTTGNDSALLGSGQWQGSCVYSGTNTATQTGMVAPAGTSSITVDELELCAGNGSYVNVSLTDNTSGGTQSCQDCQYDVVTACTLPVTPGHSYTLSLTNHDQTGSGFCSETFFDNVRWSTVPAVSSLLNNYDMVMLPCDGGGEYNSSNWGGSYDDPGRVNLVNYAGVGGRVFTSHWGREWIERPSGTLPAGPFNNVANWIGDQALGDNTGVINTVPVYGQNFDAWMKAVGATANTTFSINPDREDTSSVIAPSRLFVSYLATGWPADFTFDTPIGGTATGRVMYTDMHLATGNPSGTFPNNCTSAGATQGGALSQQEDAAEYLIFDLGACVSGLPIPGPSTQDNPVTFTVDYSSDGAPIDGGVTSMCPSGTHVRWTELDYQGNIPIATADGSAPSGASIVFAAQTANSPAPGMVPNYAGVQSVTLATETQSTPTGCTPDLTGAGRCKVDIDTSTNVAGSGMGAFNTASPPVQSKGDLRLTITLNPSSDKQETPTLVYWQVKFDCPPSE